MMQAVSARTEAMFWLSELMSEVEAAAEMLSGWAEAEESEEKAAGVPKGERFSPVIKRQADALTTLLHKRLVAREVEGLLEGQVH
jgi:hypothetical protein